MSVLVTHRPHPNFPATAVKVEADPFAVLEWCLTRRAKALGTYDAEFDRKECVRLERERQLKGKA